MNSIEEYSRLIEKEILKINYPDTPKGLYEPIKYMLGIGGKRTRPLLLLLSHSLFDKDIYKSIKPALGIEIFHNFTLLHDDIMDKAPIRRGSKTVHTKWDENTSILSGDTMLVQSYAYISSVKDRHLRDITDLFNLTARQVCEGQQMDLDFENRNKVSINEYMKMIEYKTAVLLGSSLKIGAINSNASKEDANHLYNFGLNLGISFQLKDDLLDAFGDAKLFGKIIGGDIISRKKTFLYLKALELSNIDQKKMLDDCFNNSDLSNRVSSVLKIYSDLEIEKIALEKIYYYYNIAIDHLDQVKSDDKDLLYLFAKKLKDRIS
tara:strand:+ start:19842 stop:20804 length:963 start_codon:yes stop_codon:yes gene_type:complete